MPTSTFVYTAQNVLWDFAFYLRRSWCNLCYTFAVDVWTWLNFLEQVPFNWHVLVISGPIFTTLARQCIINDTDILDMLGCWIWVKGFGCWKKLSFQSKLKFLELVTFNLLVIPKFLLNLSLPNLDLKILMHSTDVDAKSEPSVSDVEGG